MGNRQLCKLYKGVQILSQECWIPWKGFKEGSEFVSEPHSGGRDTSVESGTGDRDGDDDEITLT